MSQAGVQQPRGAAGTDRPPESLEPARTSFNGQGEAVQRLLSALDQVGREVEIAALTLDGCEDLEGTAYHLRRALANLRFASGVLVDLRKTKRD